MQPYSGMSEQASKHAANPISVSLKVRTVPYRTVLFYFIFLIYISPFRTSNKLKAAHNKSPNT